MRLITPAVLIASALAASPTIAQTTKPQYVLISFDGAHDNKLWTRSGTGEKQQRAFHLFSLLRLPDDQERPPRLPAAI